jgi:hypothetical protein
MVEVSGHSHFQIESKPPDSFKIQLSAKRPADSGGAKKNAGAHATDAGWTLEPHVCRHCFGRLASMAEAVVCTNCGATEVGPGVKVSALCACGVKINRSGLFGSVLVDAGLRCQPNPSPTPDFPSVFVAAPGVSDC